MNREHTITILRSEVPIANGVSSRNMTTSEMAGSAYAYDATRDAAPLVIGAPKLTDPAYGWVKSLEVKNGLLVATARQVEPSFAEQVKNGGCSGVSASFYGPESSNNPKPGYWYLRHIRFDGVAHTIAPLPGVQVASFAQYDDPAVISFGASYEYQPKPFGVPEGYTTDFARHELYHAAQLVQASRPGIGWMDAVRIADGRG